MNSESLAAFLKNLFNNDFMPHGHCYFWRPDIIWLHVISDGIIALSYYAIPFILLFFMFKRKDFPFPMILIMFGAFILFCGTTHLMGIVTLWDPVYRLDGIIKAATAGISALTTIMLIPLIPMALALKSPKELEAANLKLADANEKLKEIDRLKDNFFSNISHELRTPLTLILSPLESFLANDYGTLTDMQRTNLQSMHNNSIRLFQMVNSILDFAKISAKKIEVRREPLDIMALTKSIVQEFESMAKQKHIQIQFTNTSEKNIVDMDRYLYERILFNLLSNAVKFTPESGKVTTTLTIQKNKAILTVCDTGIGISHANQEKLFQRFQQIEGSSTRRFEGTGLGLSLVKEFALLLDGDVKVDSEPNQGSCFIVEIYAPLSKTASNLEVKPLSGRFQKYDVISTQNKLPTVTDKNSAKILIAEDNVELASYIATLLTNFAQTKHVADGNAALEAINTWEPDLAIIDVMMPKKDGISVCKQIKSSPKNSHIPVILLTALTHRDALTRGWEAGADEYLFKPFHPKELATRVKSLLENAINNKLLQELNKDLVVAARLAGRSEVAIGILHNVGNILNSLNISIDILINTLTKSKVDELKNLILWIQDAFKNSADFIKDTDKQTKLITYLNELQNVLLNEKTLNIKETNAIKKNINIIIEIIARQKNFSGPTGVIQTVNLAEICDDAIAIGLNKTENIRVIREYKISKATLDKTRLQQIMINLIINAKEALMESQQQAKQIIVTIQKTQLDKEWLEIDVSDNGCGISAENLEKIFNLGFTTKKTGSGFGLHVSYLSAQEMGGSLRVTSKGENLGSSFTLRLPITPENIKDWVKI